MNNYLIEVNVNLLNGVMQGMIQFEPGLNIISGENGTLKTKLLQYIKSNNGCLAIPGEQIRTQAISPKRNAERRNQQQILQYIRQNSRTLDITLSESLAWQINDQTFANYPTIGDMYYLVFEDFRRDGSSGIEQMGRVTDEFNTVIGMIFEEYRLFAQWNEQTGLPDIKILKYGRNEVPIESLSLGEQEILSLVLNLYATRAVHDLYIIDEPEVHLNWHLEERLFSFMNWFAEEFHKQIIVVTHGRAIFKPDFIRKVQFLRWNDEGKVIWSREIDEKQRARLAGEAINIIKLGNFATPTFFVEDSAHRRVISTLASTLGVNVVILECGNSANVKSLYRLSKSESGWPNSVFVIDGDNEGNSFPNQSDFIQIDAYCIENYLLNFEIAALAADRTVSDIQEIITDCIRDNCSNILKKNKFLEFLILGLRAPDVTAERLSRLDASVIMESFTKKLGIPLDIYIQKYIKLCAERQVLSQVFPQALIGFLESSIGRPQ